MLLKGKPIAKKLRQEIIARVADFKTRSINPKLVVVLLKGDPASEIYARMIVKNCAKSEILAEQLELPADITETDLLAEISKINEDAAIHGLIVMFPLPKHIDENRVMSLIDPLKDVDGVNPFNAGKLALGQKSPVPATAMACREIIANYDIDLNGKHVVIVGRSNIVGKPLANLLLHKGAKGNCTVTVCHSRTKNIPELTRNADIVVAAIGKANFLTEDYFSEDQVVVDVGMNESYDADGKFALCGDVDFANVESKVKAITPVPGGMSPLTHIAIQTNLLDLMEEQSK